MKKLKKVLLPLVCKYLLRPKSFLSIPENVRRIDCRTEEVHLLSNTSNNVYAVSVEGKKGFFRECKKHSSLADYVQECIDVYYSTVTCDIYGDKSFLEECLKDKKRLKTFSNMGMTNDRTSGAYQFLMGNGAHHIGLPDVDAQRAERLKDIVQYIWGDLFGYGLNSGVKRGYFQTYNAVRCIATYRVAEMIGLGDMIPKTEYVLLCQEGREPIFGTFMESAPGICMERLPCKDRREVSSPRLQRALNNLNLLDVLNLEKDHRTGNYHVVIQEGKGIHVVAFDNDSPNGFGLGGISFSTYMGCSPWCINGKLNRPYVDKDLADRILSLENEQIDLNLGDVLNRLQLSAFKKRLKQVKGVLRSAPASVYLTPEKWSETTLERELSEEYGMTYLHQFLGEQKLMEQPWIKERSS